MPLSWLEIDLGALRHNFFQARARLAPGTRVLGVVKSDAYGHGMIAVSRELEACGADFLGVSQFWEARELRDHGLTLPILVLLGIEPEEMEDALRLGVRPVVYRLDHAGSLSRAACRVGAPAHVHLKMDTGMGRLGVAPERLPGFLDELLSLPGIRIEGLISHFAAADEEDKTYSEEQIARLQDALKLLGERGSPAPCVHIANSAGILDLPAAHFHMVRAGIMLYGSCPSDGLRCPPDLRPVMRFKSKIIQLKDVAAGRCIGYGRTYVTQRPSRIATIPVGYDDGYSRLLSNRGVVLVGGRRAPVVGRVSMSMITADVTHIPEAREDDEVVLLGAQGEECIPAEELADLCGTISYEIYCGFGRRHSRRFVGATETRL